MQNSKDRAQYILLMMLKNKIALVTGGSQGIGKAITAMMIDSAIRARAAATGVDVEGLMNNTLKMVWLS